MEIDSVDVSFDQYTYGIGGLPPVAAKAEDPEMLEAAYFSFLYQIGLLSSDVLLHAAIPNDADKVLLQNAITKKDPNAAQILIEYGNNPKGWPAICYAASLGKEDIVKILVEYGANVNSRCNGGSVLDMAVDQKNISMIRFLASKGAVVDQAFFDRCLGKDFQEGVVFYFSLGNKLPPEVAAKHVTSLIDKNKPVEFIKVFVEQHKDEMFKKHYGISGSAIGRGDANLLKYLVEKGMPIETSSTTESNVIYHVVRANRIDLLTIIFSTGAKIPPLVRCTAGGDFPRLIWHTIFRNNINYEMVTLLLKNGLPVDHNIGYDFGYDGDTEWFRSPLHEAIFKQNAKLVKMLLEHGAKVNLRFQPESQGPSDTPLKLAINSKNKEIVDLLLCFGAKIEGDV